MGELDRAGVFKINLTKERDRNMPKKIEFISKTTFVVVCVFALIVFSICLFSGKAHAGAINTGYDLLKTCESEKVNDKLACLNYITGVIDGIAFQRGFMIGILSAATQTRLTKYPVLKHYCIPHGATFGQLRLILTKYLFEHPDVLHIIPPILIRDALQNAFPCK